MALLTIRKHRLWEVFLVQKLGFNWDEVHEVAEQIEHIDAPKFFARMDELMGHPTVDPHGSPIPSAEGVIAEHDYRTLDTVEVGARVSLRAVSGQEDALFSYLTRKGIALGTAFEIVAVEGFDGSLRVRYGSDNREETLTVEVARRLLVG